MPPLFERVIGLALIVAASTGLLFNLFVLAILPRVAGESQARVEETLTILNGTLTTTNEALLIIDRSVDDVSTTMAIARSATLEVSTALSDTVPLLDTMATITGEELPTSVVAAQRSLDAAQASAASVESVLFALNTSLAFLGSIPLYNPDMPLTETLADVSESLDPLVASMEEVETNLVVATENMEAIQTEVEELALNFDRIERTVEDARGVTSQYQEVISDQQAVITDLQRSAGSWITWGRNLVIMVLLWLVLAQLGLLSQGIEMFLRGRRHERLGPSGGAHVASD